MGDHQDASTNEERNPSSPAAGMSGIDWSIFKDGEEDAFGWLLRNNNVSASAAAAMSAGMLGGVSGADILPLDDIEMDRMVAGPSGLAQQHVTKAQPVGGAAVVGGFHALSAAQTNARLLAAQLYEGLRSSPSNPPANLLSMLPSMPPFGNAADGDYDNFDDDDAWEEELEEEEEKEAQETAANSTPTGRGTKRGSGAASSRTIEEKALAGSRSTRGKTKANTASAAKSKRPLKRKKSGPASPTATGSGTEEDLEKKQQRRVKNLVSVREFRKRKMKQLEQNEARLRRLEAENMDLKMRLKIGKEAILSEQREKKQIKEQMREMLQRNANEQEIAQFLNMYKVTYSDYGPKRREKLHFHLSRIRELLLPTQVTKLSLYSVEQGVDMLKRDHVIKEDPMSAPESATATMSLWGILADELEVSDEQQRQILERRAAIKKVRDDLNHTLSIVKKLEEVTDEKNTALEAQVAQLQQILTPSQATKFIIWVKENPAFMYMLDKLVDSTLQNTSSTEE
ncbi:camp responsive element modulator [Phytophthora cinnamomi]|uniref:camp responsive element modulator n=1 Tax=Phytophthora cinnamomi TaxID=4785 RepID=UPI003559C5AF|nr:camp responsive element modulator [Phytophthora cinnamomi]